MVKEINLFENEIETADPVEDSIVPVNVQPLGTQKPAYYQPTLPGVPEKPQQVFQETQQREKHLRLQVKRIIEALLFASSAPVPFNKLREVTDAFYALRPRMLRELIMDLQQEYLSQQRSFRLEEIAQGFILRTCEDYSPYIDLMYKNKRTERLSHAAAEVLAIIAYKQPITRPQIDAIRGVDSSGTVYSLLERQLIEPVGKLEAPGRPTLFGITKDFLQHFGLRDVKELPPLG